MHMLAIMFSVLLCRYSVVVSCWKTDPDNRPVFKELTSTLTSRLERMAGYLRLLQ